MFVQQAQCWALNGSQKCSPVYTGVLDIVNWTSKQKPNAQFDKHIQAIEEVLEKCNEIRCVCIGT